MTQRVRLTRDLFIKRGLEANKLERLQLGIPLEVQIAPDEAWHALYGNRKWVYLEVDSSDILLGGRGHIVDDEVGNGFYRERDHLDG